VAKTFPPDDLDSIGEAISILVQQRYVWLFLHICRARELDALDKGWPLPGTYFFSAEDQHKGLPSVDARQILNLVRREAGSFAVSTRAVPKTYDYNYVREITTAGMRGIILVAVQSYLENYRILHIIRRHKPSRAELFVFIREARNIICHSRNAVMDSDRIRPCSWRGIRIDKNGQELKMSDYQTLMLIDDAIEALGELYTEQGRQIDYVSLNLGYTVPYIRDYIRRLA